MDFYEKALSLSRAAGDRKREAAMLDRIATIYANLGEKQKTLGFFNQALQLRRAASDPDAEAATLNNIGLAYANLGEKQKALDHYRQALQLSQTIGERHGEAATLYLIARLERDRGNLVDARNRVEAALAAVESLRVDVTSQQLRASFFASVRKYHEFYIDLLMGLHKQRPSEGFDAVALARLCPFSIFDTPISSTHLMIGYE